MSGSSSSNSGFDDWRPGGGRQNGGDSGGGSGGGTDRCAIYETTVLASPVSNVIASLNVGDILFVGLETTPRNRVVVRTAAGAVAGAVTSVQIGRNDRVY